MPENGATYGGPGGFTYGGATGTTYAGTVGDQRPAQEPRGFTYGGSAGATYGGRSGALYGVTETPDGLLAATDSWGLVVAPVPEIGHTDELLLFTSTGSEPEADGSLLGFSATIETLAAASLSVEFAAGPRLFRFAQAEWVLGFGGERVLNGRFEAPDADTGSQQASIQGFGPLQRLKSGGVDVSYAGMPAWQAIEQFASDEITPRTGGDIRVVVVAPNPGQGEREAQIPADAPIALTGTPLSAFAELCGYAGMVWSVDYTQPGPGVLVEVFLPGTQLRPSRWTAAQGGASPQLDTGDYHTDVVIHGASLPGVGEVDIQDQDRYYGEASAPEMEVRAITGGERRVFETVKDSLESDAACREFARSKLDELRGTYQLSGDLDVLPGIAGALGPGHVYRVPEFDSAAPAALTPAALPLRSVEYSYARGETSRTLSFGKLDESVVGTLLGIEDPPLALRGLGRLDDLTFAGPPDTRNAYASAYPHNHPKADNTQ